MKAELLKDGVTQHKSMTSRSIHPGKSAKEWWRWRGHPWSLLSTSWEEPGAALHADMHKSTQNYEGGTLRIPVLSTRKWGTNGWTDTSGEQVASWDWPRPPGSRIHAPNHAAMLPAKPAKNLETEALKRDRQENLDPRNRRSLKSKSLYQMFLWTFRYPFAHPFLSLPSSTPHILSSTLPAPLTTLFLSFQRKLLTSQSILPLSVIF